MKSLSKLLLFSGLFLCLSVMTQAKTIRFSGFDWTVRGNVYGAPGKNYWRSENVWVDDAGRLHLAIKKVNGVWTCAELQTVNKYLYGKYSFNVIGRIDRLDKNVVVGLFNYPTEAAKQGLGEIDIEFAKWGNAANGGGNFTVWSDRTANLYYTKNFPFQLDGDFTKHNFTRTSKSVFFQSFYGHTEINEIFNWKYTGADISKTPMPIYINFWLYRGLAPSDGKDAEIIISEVKFVP